jgi:peptide/nickel transport system substrate-binding protein
MFKALLQSLATIALMLALVVICAIMVWQNNRIETNQIKQLAEQEENETECVQSAGTASSDGPLAQYAFAFDDPSNLLEPDPVSWLPAEAKRGGKLLNYLGSDPKGLNFLTQNGADVSHLQSYIGIGLVRNHFEDTSKYAPDLAYHMSRDEDYLVYTFRLRQDIYWHAPTVEKREGQNEWLFEGKSCREGHFKNGRCRVTAHDMVFMMDMMMNNQVAGAAPMRSYFSNLDFVGETVEEKEGEAPVVLSKGSKGYRAIDDFTFEIRFNKKTQTQDRMVRGLFPMPEFLYAYDEEGGRYDDSILGTKFEAHWYDPNAIGAGPYRFMEFEPGVKITLERDPRYPMGGNAHKEILFQIINDDLQRVRKLKTEELDYSSLSPSQYRVEVLEGGESSPFNDGTLGGDEYWSHTYFYIGWNTNSPIFKEKKVRQAMSHAFNADLLLEDVMMGLGRRCTGPMPAFLPYYDESIPAIPFDLEKAKELLSEAGWADADGNGILEKEIDGAMTDFEFNLTIFGSSKEYKTIGDIFKEDLAKIGVKLNVQPTEWAMLLKRVDAREFDAVTLAWVSGPDVDFRQIWHSSQADEPQSSNYISFRNEDADKIIEELEVTFDYDRRVELAHQFHKLLYEEQAYTFFYTRRSSYYWNKRLKNVKSQLTRPYLNARAWYLGG